MTAVAVAGALCIALGVVAVSIALGRVHRVSVPHDLVGPAVRPSPFRVTTSSLARSIDDGLARRDWAHGLTGELPRAGLDWTAGEFVLAAGALSFAALLGVTTLSGSLLIATPAATAVAAGARVAVRLRSRRYVDRFERQLPEALDVLAGSLEAGAPLAQAMDMVATEGDPPVSAEFTRVLADTRLGVPITEAVDRSAARVGSRDYAWCVRAVRAQQEFGASLAGLLRTLAEFMRFRQELRGEVRALTAEGRISAVILVGLPIALGAFFLVVNPSYMSVLTATPMGWAMLGLAGVLMAVGSTWMHRIVKVEV